MTLQEIWCLLRRYIKCVVSLSIACALVGSLGYYAIRQLKHNAYSATVQVAITDPSGLLNPSSLSAFSYAQVSDFVEQSYGSQGVEVSMDASGQGLTVVAESDENDTAAALAYDAAFAVKDEVEAALKRQAEKYLQEIDGYIEGNSLESAIGVLADPGIEDRAAALEACSVIVVGGAKGGEGAWLVACARSAVIGLLIGFVSVMIALIVKASVKRPIMSKEDAAKASGMRVFSDSDSMTEIRRMWGYFEAVCSKRAASVCVMPVEGDIPKVVSDRLISEAPAHMDLTVSCMTEELGLSAACEADAVLLVARKWVDTDASLSEASKDLKVAGANGLSVLLIS